MIWILFFSWMLVCSIGGMVVKYYRKKAIKETIKERELSRMYMRQFVIMKDKKYITIPMN